MVSIGGIILDFIPMQLHLVVTYCRENRIHTNIQGILK